MERKKPFIAFVKCADKSKSSWSSVLNIFRSSGLICSNLVPVNDGFKAYLPERKYVDMLFSDEVTKKLADLRCSVIKPPYLTTSRTIVVTRVNRFIMEHGSEEIEEEINSSNEPWLVISNVFKFPSGKTFKFECNSAEMAEKCIKEGLFAFNLSIQPYDLSLEASQNIQYCFKCYAIDDHTSKYCEKEKNYKVCSLCASTSHTYKECDSTVRNCINCGGQHPTMSKSCLKYREAVAAKENSSNKMASTPSYIVPSAFTNKINKQPQLPANPSQKDSYDMSPKFGINRDDVLRIYMVFIYASSVESEEQGTFDSNLQKLLKANNLPSIDVAGIKPPCIFSEVPGATKYSLPQTAEQSETEIQSAIAENSTSDVAAGNVNREKVPEIKTTSSQQSSNNQSSSMSTSILQPSRHSQVFGNNASSTRSNKYACKIFTPKGFQLGKGQVLRDNIKSKKTCIEHSCVDEKTCIVHLSRQILIGDLTKLQIFQLAERKFNEKVQQLVSLEL